MEVEAQDSLQAGEMSVARKLLSSRRHFPSPLGGIESRVRVERRAAVGQ